MTGAGDRACTHKTRLKVAPILLIKIMDMSLKTRSLPFLFLEYFSECFSAKTSSKVCEKLGVVSKSLNRKDQIANPFQSHQQFGDIERWSFQKCITLIARVF